MNKYLDGKLNYARNFFHFLSRSGNRYRVHSPYLYSFIGEVLRKDPKPSIFDKIKELRRDISKSGEIISKTDYGNKKTGSAPATYAVSVRQIARTSLTSPRHARRLFRLAKHLNAKNILEIGTSLGFTTAYLAMANPEARIITLEGCPELCRLAKDNFQKLGISNVEIMEGRFEDTLSGALTKLKTLDLVYVDGNHHKKAMISYFEKCLKHCHNETVMVFDDIHASTEMEEAWEIIVKRDEISVSIDLFFQGIVFLRKESSKQHFKLRYF